MLKTGPTFKLGLNHDNFQSQMKGAKDSNDGHETLWGMTLVASTISLMQKWYGWRQHQRWDIDTNLQK